MRDYAKAARLGEIERDEVDRDVGKGWENAGLGETRLIETGLPMGAKLPQCAETRETYPNVFPRRVWEREWIL